MKRTLLALATLTAFAGVASAQSSVTIAGIVDLAARNVKNGSAGSLKTLSSGGQATNRLIVRGIEDLGGGLRAGFWLESEVGPDTGSAGSTVGTSTNVFWARRSTVSLLGGFGEVRLGRDLNVSFTNVSAADPFGYVGVASLANLRGQFLGYGGAITAVRTSNSIAYYLPALGGVYGGLMVGAGEGSAAGNSNKYVGGRLGYAAGPVNVSAASAKTYKTGAMVDDLQSTSIQGSFNAGFATFGGVYEKSKYSVLDQKLASVYTTVPLGSGTLKAQYTKVSGTGNAATRNQYDAKMFGLSYVYNLSKRTSLYTNYGNVNNGGSTVTGANYTASGSGPAGIRRGETSTGYEFGIRHDF